MELTNQYQQTIYIFCVSMLCQQLLQLLQTALQSLRLITLLLL